MDKNKMMVLVLDIDGTLTNSKKEITERTKEAVIDTMKRGHKVILASGRPTYGMRRYEKELMLDENGGYLLSFNGGRMTCQAKSKKLKSRKLKNWKQKKTRQ